MKIYSYNDFSLLEKQNPFARVTMTNTCNRKCRGCCNKLITEEPKVTKIENITGYQKVFVTGGEPMLFPDKLLQVVKKLRNQGNDKIYLYTAWPYPKKIFLKIVKYLDGVTLALHTHLDKLMFFDNGYDKMDFPNKEMWLNVFSTKNLQVEGNWVVRPKKWVKECPMPPGEDLLTIKESYTFDEILEEKIKESPITDINKYNQDMIMSMEDKLFFLNKINTDLLVDFGCADAKVLSEIRKRKPQLSLMGYDISNEMLNIARTNLPNATFTNNWNEVKSAAYNHDNPALLLSSVIHEVYSYSDTKDIKPFWNDKVFGGLFKYIVIRDMIPSVDLQRQDFLKFREDAKKINKYADKKYLNSFERIWGLIDNDYRTLLHWLLKYPYIDNWEREVKENYLPLTLETLYKKIPSNYKIIYKNHYIFAPLRNNVFRDFGINLNHTTHTKMIIERV
jgi:hypothetical protein